jgi:NAD(P)-dependent dehydrogenase (short-subunit alcohol dehydrogenase family)
MNLAGKVVMITGASSGIGRETALLLGKRRASVVLLARRFDRIEAAAKQIEADGGGALPVAADVADAGAVQAAVDRAIERFGRVDVLVNNAGIAGANKPTHELSEEEWDRVQAVNVKGVFFCTKHAIPLMKKAGGGSIVHVSSIYGLMGAPDVPPYHASKGAVRLMAKTDALLYAPDRIRVNSVHPGFIWTSMVENHLKSLGDLAAGRKAVDALHPLGHMGDADDIAWGVVYLASDEAKFVTGTELVIDGGYTCR